MPVADEEISATYMDCGVLSEAIEDTSCHGSWDVKGLLFILFLIIGLYQGRSVSLGHCASKTGQEAYSRCSLPSLSRSAPCRLWLWRHMVPSALGSVPSIAPRGPCQLGLNGAGSMSGYHEMRECA